MPTERAPSTTVVRRQLGRRLRRLREGVGKKHADLEEARIASRTTMWRIEKGKIPVREGQVFELCRFYGATHEETDALVELAAGTRGGGWFEEFGQAVPDGFNLYADLESSSSAVNMWHPELVPGLLQTEAYARALISSLPYEPDELESRVAFRMERQRAVLDGNEPPMATAVLGAGALLLAVGSEAVMEEQRDHLRTLGQRPMVDVKVLPWDAGPHPSTKGAFTLLDYDDPDDPAMVFVEAHHGDLYIDDATQVAEYRRVFDIVHELARSIEEYE
jgi:hypothetical protein